MKRAVTLIGVISTAILWCAVVALLVLRWFGVYFVAAEMPIWAISNAVIISIGLLISALTLYAMYTNEASRAQLLSHNVFLRAILPVAFVGMNVFCLYIVLFDIAPMAHTTFKGSEGMLELTVKDTHDSGSRREACYNAVEVENRSIMNAKICGVPDEIRNDLVDGGKIAVFGKMSTAGVYYKQVGVLAQ